MHSCTELIKSYVIGPLDIREELSKLYLLRDEWNSKMEHHMRWDCPISTERVLALLFKNGERITELEKWRNQLEICEASIESLLHR